MAGSSSSLADLDTKPEHLKILESWLKSYKPEQLFDKNGKLIAELAELALRRGKKNGGKSSCEWRTFAS